ncbi:hypothetical protein VTK73DRAFT_7224 [Phialemonium thermophilum]|uniref:FAD-binding FR-type domain-containing protein n=1 Tax=Phialemonium thermophilum TaxID=223376 RepID=A0ABR3WFL5_9PEZI
MKRMSLRAAATASTLLWGRAVLGGGLVGFGLQPYDPTCAYACDRSFSMLMLDCSTPMDMSGGMEMDMDGGSPIISPRCRAGNTPWLTSMAWCVHTQCASHDVLASDIEAFWAAQVTEDPSVPPKWDFGAALAQATKNPPTKVLAASAEWLNHTALVNPDVYLSHYNAMVAVQRENEVESAFGIAIIVAGFGTPVVLSWMGYMPYMSRALNKVKPYLVYPSLVGTYQVRPLPYLLGNAPTVGQSLFVFLFFALNLVLMALGYRSMQPHAWFPTASKEILAYIFYRAGTLGFVLIPLLILFSSRNNVLLWATNWSHSTFLLLHRWVARMFALQALLHTLLALPLYWPGEARKAYWIWGAVATIAAVVLVFGSGLYVRRPAYEVFLVSHVVLSVFVLVGCWYHIKLWMPQLGWGYETWLYAGMAVWSFDRLLRVMRVLKTGVRRARVVELGGDDGQYVRVDIEGLRWGPEPGQHVYAYFPTLRPWTPWENHPFSVVPSALLQPPAKTTDSSGRGRPTVAEATGEVEKQQRITEAARMLPAATPTSSRTSNSISRGSPPPTVGLTLYIKKASGITKYLRAEESLLTLLEGPYSSQSTKAPLRCDRLLLIGGGIGITSLVPWVTRHWNVKLCWSVRESARCLVDEMEGPLSRVAEKDVRVGARLDFHALLAAEERHGWATIGVVVSGPGGLCDDVRAAVTTAARAGKAVFELEVDAYSW